MRQKATWANSKHCQPSPSNSWKTEQKSSGIFSGWRFFLSVLTLAHLVSQFNTRRNSFSSYWKGGGAMTVYQIAGDYDGGGGGETVLNISKQASGHQKQFCKDFLGCKKRYFFYSIFLRRDILRQKWFCWRQCGDNM